MYKFKNQTFKPSGVEVLEQVSLLPPQGSPPVKLQKI